MDEISENITSELTILSIIKRPHKSSYRTSPAKEDPEFNIPQMNFYSGVPRALGSPGGSPQDQLG